MSQFNIYLVDTNPLLQKYGDIHLTSVLRCLSKIDVEYNSVPKFHFVQESIKSFLTANGSELATGAVTPSNSLSYMGGGFDRYLLEALLVGTGTTDYKVLERMIQEHSLGRNCGFMPVNSINITNIATICQDSLVNYSQSSAYKNWRLEQIIQIPTMVVPSNAPTGVDLFNTMWELMVQLDGQELKLSNLITPGLGTGYGKLDHNDAARIMIAAFVFFSLKISAQDARIGHLRKSMLILFFLKEDYRLFELDSDVSELEKLTTNFGKQILSSKDFQNKGFMEWDDLFRCINWENKS